MKPVTRTANIMRLVALGVVLLVVIIGAVWEFGFTLRGHRNALNELEVVAQTNMTDAQSREDVLKVLPGEPTETEYKKLELNSLDGPTAYRLQRIDRYQWTRMIPGKKNLVVFVSYDCMATGEDAESFDPKNCSDSDWTFRAFYEPGNAPVTVTVKSRKKPPLAEVLFQNLDDDVDGFLSENEITARSSILKQMDVFDPNGDKKISLEELKDAISKLEEQKGRKLTTEEVYGFFGGLSPGEGVGGAAGTEGTGLDGRGPGQSPDGGGPGGKGPGGKGPGGKGPGGKGPGGKGKNKKDQSDQ